MSDTSKIMKTLGLDHYSSSPIMMERFSKDINIEGKEISRSINEKGVKKIDLSEIESDGLGYFIDNKKSLEDEFFDCLCLEIGSKKANLFCEIVSEDWFKGGALRNGKRVNELKSSVGDYISEIKSDKIKLSELVVKRETKNSSFTIYEIMKILTLNDQLMLKHIEEWKSQHPDKDTLNMDNIYLRRGLYLDNEINTTLPYPEWSYINSYSLSISVPEKFSKIKSGKMPTLIHADLPFFNGRILFFSPFIPNMNSVQLEVGVIPSDRLVSIKSHGIHSEYREYTLD